MRDANCWICGTAARKAAASENDKHTRVECPTCGTYRLDERAEQELGQWLLKMQKAGVEPPRPPNHEALSTLIRKKYDESGGEEVFISDFEALQREASM